MVVYFLIFSVIVSEEWRKRLVNGACSFIIMERFRREGRGSAIKKCFEQSDWMLGPWNWHVVLVRHPNFFRFGDFFSFKMGYLVWSIFLNELAFFNVSKLIKSYSQAPTLIKLFVDRWRDWISRISRCACIRLKIIIIKKGDFFSFVMVGVGLGVAAMQPPAQ